MKKLIPADTVDTNGTVWETAGENIRRGAKEFSVNDVKSIINILFPVGSIFCGENSLVTSVGIWTLITNYGSYIISGGDTDITGNTTTGTIQGSENGNAYLIRMWKRVE